MVVLKLAENMTDLAENWDIRRKQSPELSIRLPPESDTSLLQFSPSSISFLLFTSYA